jgi:hypothetical protein
MRAPIIRAAIMGAAIIGAAIVGDRDCFWRRCMNGVEHFGSGHDDGDVARDKQQPAAGAGIVHQIRFAALSGPQRQRVGDQKHLKPGLDDKQSFDFGPHSLLLSKGWAKPIIPSIRPNEHP